MLAAFKHARAPIAGLYDVRRFGAAGDGRTIDTPAINKALEAAHIAGGGTVLVPAGTYLCYSIHLQSNVSLYLDAGATIRAAEPPKPPSSAPAYDEQEPNPFGRYQSVAESHSHDSLIWGENLENVSILGPGLIDGAGRLVRDQVARPWGVANKAISLKVCRNVTIRDISIRMAGHFSIMAIGVDNLTIDNVKIDTDRDGMDMDCCRNVHISNCTVNTPNDDAICLKSSFALGTVRATENVMITNCVVSGYKFDTVRNGTFEPPGPEQLPVGRIKLGSQSYGGFKNITISNCAFEYCHGLALECVDGGALEDVTISNIAMRHIYASPFFLRLGSRMQGPPGLAVGTLRRINISNVVVYDDESRICTIISGVPGHYVQDVTLSNIRLVCQGGGTKEQASTRPVEDEKGYPEPENLGTMPAYGFFIRHAEGIEMNNISVSYIKDDARPPFALHDVKEIRFNGLNAQHAAGTAVMALKKVENLEIHQGAGMADRRIGSADDEVVNGK